MNGEKSYKAKTPLGEFTVTTSKNPLFNNQVVTNIRNRITTLSYLIIQTCS